MATVTGTAVGETLTGTRLQDEIFGLGGDDTIRGRAGNDMIDGGTGNDVMIGRSGSEYYWVDSELDKVVERPNEGETDTVFSTVSFTLAPNIETLQLRGEAVRGDGNGLDNRLLVEGGQDVDNVLNGRGGADFMSGGLGNDIYYVDDAGDMIEETGSDIDSVRSSVSLDLQRFGNGFVSVFVENLTLLGSADLDATGGKGVKNHLIGNSGANELRGMGGVDVLVGKQGNDSLYGGLDVDRDILKGGAGQDGFYFEIHFSRDSYEDIIRDFTATDDTIYLARSESGEYTGMPEGELPESAFVRGTAAQDINDRILYDSTTGKIYYDPDGIRSEGPVVFARVAPGTEVNASDFIGY